MSKRENFLLTSGVKLAYVSKQISIGLPVQLTKTNKQILNILQDHGVVRGYKKSTTQLRIQIHELAFENPKSTVIFFKRNQKIYITVRVLKNYYGSLPKHVFILNTKSGIVTSIEALKYNMGGYLVGAIY